MRKLWLDNVRPAPNGWVWVQTAEEALELLRSGRVDYASLDHDLGPGRMTGTQLVEAIAHYGAWPRHELNVHSGNPSGAQRMRDIIEVHGPYKRRGVVLFRTPSGRPSERLWVEVANTPDLRDRGLSRRRWIDPDYGMLFLFPDPGHRTMWMKDTHVPLDIMFVDANDQVIATIENTEPLSTAPLQIRQPSTAIVEARAGFVRKNDITPGTLVAFYPFRT